MIAVGLVIVLGTPAAYLIATRSFRARPIVLTLVELPLVLPPAVAGIGLLAAFGRAGLLGDELGAIGLSVPFTQIAVVLAVAFVAGPVLRAAGDRGVRGRRPDAALRRTDARGRAGAVVRPRRASTRRRWARRGRGARVRAGLGEFGATIMFAGSLQGVTQTLSLAIYQEFDVNFDGALAISALLVLVSAALLLTVKIVFGWRSSSIISHPLRTFRLAVALAVGAETLALVGPSGAGKTSVLRAIAGLLHPEPAASRSPGCGSTRRRSIDLPPERRRVGFVFQEYALFPHLSVRANVAFGRGARRVDELLERLRIAHLADQRPHLLGRRAPARRAGTRAGP